MSRKTERIGGYEMVVVDERRWRVTESRCDRQRIECRICGHEIITDGASYPSMRDRRAKQADHEDHCHLPRIAVTRCAHCGHEVTGFGPADGECPRCGHPESQRFTRWIETPAIETVEQARRESGR